MTEPTEQSAAPDPFAQPPGLPSAPAHYAYQPPMQAGPVGEVRKTGICILLFVVTFGIYGWYWFYKVHDEMKRNTGTGLGGGIALLLAILVGFAMPYVTSSEVGTLYKRRGQAEPVSALTGLWYFPGMLILVGPIVWFVKTNRALNDYWTSLGAR